MRRRYRQRHGRSHVTFVELTEPQRQFRGYRLNRFTAVVGVLSLLLTGVNFVASQRRSAAEARVQPTVVLASSATPMSVITVDIFDGLDSANRQTVLNTLSKLGIRLDYVTNQVSRGEIFSRVADFIRADAPAPSGPTYEFCTRRPGAVELRPEVQAAVDVLVKRRGADLNQVLDLSTSNLAYASLPNQLLSNLNLDGSLLCRASLAGSVLTGSTFAGANLRYAVATGSVGLNQGDLRNAASLCGLVLPLPLRPIPELRKLEATDPEPHLKCNVA